jgi:hypothetical protein
MAAVSFGVLATRHVKGTGAGHQYLLMCSIANWVSREVEILWPCK